MALATAILAYGYALADFLPDGERPAWWEADTDLYEAIGDLLHVAHRASGRRSDPDDERGEDWIGGVTIETYGEDDTDRCVLAAVVHYAYNTDATAISELTVPADADQALAWAMKALGFSVTELQPSWHLAAWRE